MKLSDGDVAMAAVDFVEVVTFPVAAVAAGATASVRNVGAAKDGLGLAADALGHVTVPSVQFLVAFRCEYTEAVLVLGEGGEEVEDRDTGARVRGPVALPLDEAFSAVVTPHLAKIDHFPHLVA